MSKEGSADFVAPAERIAGFDNDGTLWSEQPMYVQLAFALDRVKALAPQHPEWKEQQPFKAALEGDMKALAESGEHGLLESATAGPGPRLGLLVHHDDAEREYAYDRKSAMGRLDRGLDEAPRRGWVLVSMKGDWRQVFAPGEGSASRTRRGWQ